MSLKENLEKDIENIDNEICRMERLGMESDSYYCLLQLERSVKISELQHCIENNL